MLLFFVVFLLRWRTQERAAELMEMFSRCTTEMMGELKHTGAIRPVHDY